VSSRSETTEIDPIGFSEGILFQSREVRPLEFKLAVDADDAPSELDPEKADETTETGEVKKLRDEIEALNARVQMCKDEKSEELAAERTRHFNELSQEIAREKKNVVRALEQWGNERLRYYASAESEVVKLSLAIASRILHREVQMDPVILQGVVRVALEQIKDADAIVLRIPETDVREWEESFSNSEHLQLQIVGESNMQKGQCVLESSVGVVDLGIGAQMLEIERGFFDLLKKRPV
jgi:flagellar assembly protein FliH